jgi:hypothetical protein
MTRAGRSSADTIDRAQDRPRWVRAGLRQDDGQEYIHVKSPQGGFEVVINAAACDSPAPRWLMLAIRGMDDS